MPRGDWLFQQKGQRLFPKIRVGTPDSGELGNLKNDSVIKKDRRQVEFLETLIL